MKGVTTTAGWLLVIGGLSIGLDALLGYNLLDSVLSADSLVNRLVGLAIGASALYVAYNTVSKK